LLKQELRDELAKRGLETDGLKAVLVERLEGAIKAAGHTEQVKGSFSEDPQQIQVEKQVNTSPGSKVRP
jgi:hypothetical protein